jgi:YVTN family beta-propeller protein
MEAVRSKGRAAARLGILFAAALAGAGGSLLGVCGPFTDTANDSFCSFVLEVFALGLTTGTTPTTFDPAGAVTRLQMATFLSRTVDRTLQRGSRRAALNQYWTTQAPINLGMTSIGAASVVQSDGVDLWVANGAYGEVVRVRGSDGTRLQTWTGAEQSQGVLVAMGRVFVAGQTGPGRLYQVDPRQAAGAVTTLASNLGEGSKGIAFDGGRIWTTNYIGSVSIVTPTVSLPWTVTTVATGFELGMYGALYDGSNVWVAGVQGSKLRKLDAAASILQTVTVGSGPVYPVFDGTNIWVPNSNSDSVSVVRASTGAVLATLTGNGLSKPWGSAFDGQRVIVTNFSGESISLWKAADFSVLGAFLVGTSLSQPVGACSDGVNFWITLNGSPPRLVRF